MSAANSLPGRSGQRILTQRQANLVEAVIRAAEDGVDLTRRELGELAGYEPGENARVAAQNTLAMPHVREAILAGIRTLALKGAPGAYQALRHVRQNGRSEAARVRAATAELAMAGIDTSGMQAGGGTGPAVAINLHLSPEFAAILTQAQAATAQVIEHEPESEEEHSPHQGVLPSIEWPARVQGATPPHPSSPAKRPGKAGPKNRAAKAVAPPPRTISPPKSSPPPVSRPVKRKVAETTEQLEARLLARKAAGDLSRARIIARNAAMTPEERTARAKKAAAAGAAKRAEAK